MKSMFTSLIAVFILIGCNNQKNRLADENNLEHQKKLAQKKAESQTQPQVIIPRDSSQGAQPERDSQGRVIQARDDSGGKAMPAPQPSPVDRPSVESSSPVPVATAPSPVSQTGVSAQQAKTTPSQSPGQEETAAQSQKRQAEEQARKQAEEQARKQAEEQARKQAQQQATKDENKGGSSSPNANGSGTQQGQGSQNGDKADKNEQYGPEYLSIDNAKFVIDALNGMSQGKAQQLLTPINIEGVIASAKLENGKLSIQLAQAGKVLAEIKDFDLDAKKDKVEAVDNGIHNVITCIADPCEVVYFLFVKPSADEKTAVLRFPGVSFKLEDKFLIAKFKPDAVYEAEMKERIAAQKGKGSPEGAGGSDNKGGSSSSSSGSGSGSGSDSGTSSNSDNNSSNISGGSGFRP